MRIDAHMHLNLNNLSLHQIIEYLDINAFDCCWLLSWEEVCPGGWPYRQLPVEDIYRAYLQYPTRVIPMYAPDPHRSDASERLVEWHERGIRGCAELKATLNWASGQVRELLKTASKHKMPILFHMEETRSLFVAVSGRLDKLIVRALNSSRVWQLPLRTLDFLARYIPWLKHWQQQRTSVFPGYMLDFASLDTVLKDFPDTKFIGHGPMFWRNIFPEASSSNPEYFPVEGGHSITCDLLRTHPNLYCDMSGQSGLSALSRDPHFSRRFLLEFGNKVLYGTDNVIAWQEKLIGSLNLPGHVRKAIFGENAGRIILPGQ